eukprot:TRINITY_DN67_c0_g1_i1.p1 TRINITY_DN67_c0_g1~~TRINITY_DN67_c0_g1_i1.p1  ORF type:complete len:1017 (-),score=119.13 TRINITY_DN67_c0_g1_i1:44-3094(-)
MGAHTRFGRKRLACVQEEAEEDEEGDDQKDRDAESEAADETLMLKEARKHLDAALRQRFAALAATFICKPRWRWLLLWLLSLQQKGAAAAPAQQLPTHVSDCGDGWFSKITTPAVDAGEICAIFGYTSIDMFGGNYGNLCQHVTNQAGNCVWGRRTCDVTVSWHCAGKANTGTATSSSTDTTTATSLASTTSTRSSTQSTTSATTLTVTATSSNAESTSTMVSVTTSSTTSTTQSTATSTSSTMQISATSSMATTTFTSTTKTQSTSTQTESATAMTTTRSSTTTSSSTNTVTVTAVTATITTTTHSATLSSTTASMTFTTLTTTGTTSRLSSTSTTLTITKRTSTFSTTATHSATLSSTTTLMTFTTLTTGTTSRLSSTTTTLTTTKLTSTLSYTFTSITPSVTSITKTHSGTSTPVTSSVTPSSITSITTTLSYTHTSTTPSVTTITDTFSGTSTHVTSSATTITTTLSCTNTSFSSTASASATTLSQTNISLTSSTITATPTSTIHTTTLTRSTSSKATWTATATTTATESFCILAPQIAHGDADVLSRCAGLRHGQECEPSCSAGFFYSDRGLRIRCDHGIWQVEGECLRNGANASIQAAVQMLVRFSMELRQSDGSKLTTGQRWALEHHEDLLTAFAKTVGTHPSQLRLDLLEVSEPRRLRSSNSTDAGRTSTALVNSPGEPVNLVPIVFDARVTLLLGYNATQRDLQRAAEDLALITSTQQGDALVTALADQLQTRQSERTPVPLGISAAAFGTVSFIEKYVLPAAQWIVGDWDASACDLSCKQTHPNNTAGPHEEREVLCSRGPFVACLGPGAAEAGSMPEQLRVCSTCAKSVFAHLWVMLLAVPVACCCGIFTGIGCFRCHRSGPWKMQGTHHLKNVEGIKVKWQVRTPQESMDPDADSAVDAELGVKPHVSRRGSSASVASSKTHIVWDVDMVKVSSFFAKQGSTLWDQQLKRYQSQQSLQSEQRGHFGEDGILPQLGRQRSGTLLDACRPDKKSSDSLELLQAVRI